MSARFKLEAVTLEGFKAFTGPQRIPFSATNVFVFGQNGRGKSSILEGIRWCLFGQGARPGEEIRNVHYSAFGPCRVELELRARDGLWRVERVLKPGGVKSDQTIRNPDGKEVRQVDVLPNVSRMGPREGTLIIYSAQQLSGRRPQADISDFDKVLYSYLNVHEVPELMRKLDDLLTAERGKQVVLSQDFEAIKGVLAGKLATVDHYLQELLRSPPWGVEAPPTHSDTREKILGVTEEAAKLTSSIPVATWSEAEMLSHASQWVASLMKVKSGEITRELGKFRNEITELRRIQNDLGEARRALAEQSRRLAENNNERKGLAGGKSLAELQAQITEIQKNLNRENARLLLATESERLVLAHGLAGCPVCGHQGSSPVAAAIRAVIQDATPQQRDLAARLDDLKSVYGKVSESEARIARVEDAMRSADRLVGERLARAATILEYDGKLTDEVLASRLQQMSELVHGLEGNLATEEQTGTDWARVIENLRIELRFHQYRDEQQALRAKVVNDLGPIEEELRGYEALIETTRTIRDRLEHEFDAALDLALPHLSAMMTEVYRRLTGQPAFDQVIVQRSKGDGDRTVLSLRVKSSLNPEYDHNPDDVLNGQANSALGLVPYFVFSQFQAETMELDLLLIDDPSQSFDTSHVDLLLKELASAASHAQLVVASHEEDRFRPGLKKFFGEGNLKLLEVAGFDPKRGPIVNER